MAGAPHEKDDVRAARDKFMKGGNIKVGPCGGVTVGGGREHQRGRAAG